MRPSALSIVVFAAALAGCASPTRSTPPGCDGKHRRPANLNGSVLNPATPAAKPGPELQAPAPLAVQPGCGQ